MTKPLFLIVGVAATALMAATAAKAGGPFHFGPFTNSYSSIEFNCNGFDILVEGEGTDSYTIFRNDAGELTRVIYRARYPHDTLTNTVSGKSIVVRGEFQEVITPIAGTDEFTKTITGFRYMVTEPGSGATIREVGRITYGELEQTIVLWQAGRHDLAFDAAFQPTFCAALA
jgi:hypothetical protein